MDIVYHTPVIHTGSAHGNGSIYRDSSSELGVGLAESGNTLFNYGGGRAGNMGSTIEGGLLKGAEIQGITLEFFFASQGECLPGARPTIVVATMQQRMDVMWKKSTHTVCGFGRMGSAVEFMDWMNRGGKPQFFLNVHGFNDGYKKYFSDCAQIGLFDKSWSEKTFFNNSVGETIDAFKKLNLNPLHTAKSFNAKSGHIDHGLRVGERMIHLADPSPPAMEKALWLLLNYDLSNIPGQNLHPEGDPLHPIVCFNPNPKINMAFKGMAEQFIIIDQAGFMPPNRGGLIQFANSFEEFEEMSHNLGQQDLLYPHHLGSKQPEAIDLTSMAGNTMEIV